MHSSSQYSEIRSIIFYFIDYILWTELSHRERTDQTGSSRVWRPEKRKLIPVAFSLEAGTARSACFRILQHALVSYAVHKTVMFKSVKNSVLYCFGYVNSLAPAFSGEKKNICKSNIEHFLHHGSSLWWMWLQSNIALIWISYHKFNSEINSFIVVRRDKKHTQCHIVKLRKT